MKTPTKPLPGLGLVIVFAVVLGGVLAVSALIDLPGDLRRWLTDAYQRRRHRTPGSTLSDDLPGEQTTQDDRSTP